MLVVQAMHRPLHECNCLWVGFLHRQVEIDSSIDADNVVYPLVEIRGEGRNRVPDLRLLNLGMLGKQGGEDQCRTLFYTEGNGFYQLDLSSVFEFLRLNSIKAL